jgi:hypothetical protein
MARRFDPDAAIADIVSAFPPGHFDKAQPLLRAYVEKLGEHDDLLVEADRAEQAGAADVAGQLDMIERQLDLLTQARKAFEDALDLAEALGVLPGDGRTKRPWLQ